MLEKGPTRREVMRSNRNIKAKRNRVVLAWHKERFSRNNVIKARISSVRLKSSNSFLEMIDSRFTIWWTDLICFKCLLKLSGRFSPKSRRSWGYHNLLYQLRGTYCHISLIFPNRPYDRIWSLFLRPLPPAALEPERDHLACELEPEAPWMAAPTWWAGPCLVL